MRAAWAAVPGRHASNRFTAAENRTQDVDGQDPLHSVDRQFVDPCFRGDYAGVRHESGDGADAVGGLEGGEHVCLDGDVGPHCHGDATCRLDVLYDGLGNWPSVVIGQTHGPPRRRG